MARKRNGGTRIVFYASDENYLAIMTAIAPGESDAPFGAISGLMNGIIEQWRAKKALESQKGAQQ